MIDFVFTIGMVIASGVGMVVLRRWLKNTLSDLLYDRSRRWYLVAVTLVAGVQAILFLVGVVLLDVAFDAGDVDRAWAALMLVALGLCDLWAGLRWKMYGEQQAKAALEARWNREERRDLAIRFLEGQGFSIVCLQEDAYAIEHRVHEVPLLRGVKHSADLIQIADQLYPLLVYQQLKGEPTDMILMKFGHGSAFNPN